MSGISTSYVFLPALLSRGPDASWTREGHASRSAYRNSLCARKQDSILSETRRATPSLCGGSVDLRAVFLRAKFFFETRPGQSTFSASIFADRRISMRSQTEEPPQGERNFFSVVHDDLANDRRDGFHLGPNGVRSCLRGQQRDEYDAH